LGRGHAVSEVLGLGSFDEDDLYAALDDLFGPPGKDRQKLFQTYLRRKAAPPRLFLYDGDQQLSGRRADALGITATTAMARREITTSSIGLLTDGEGEPLGGAGFAGNTAGSGDGGRSDQDPPRQISGAGICLCGRPGMHKQKALEEAHLRYITALTDPQIRRLLGQKVLQLSYSTNRSARWRREGALRTAEERNGSRAERAPHGRDKLGKLERKIAARK